MNEKKYYEIEWEDRVSKCGVIEASSKEEAYQKFREGDFIEKDITDCDTLSEKDDILNSINEVSNYKIPPKKKNLQNNEDFNPKENSLFLCRLHDSLHLLRKINNQDPTIQELAKEEKLRATKLMQFFESNRWSVKMGSRKPRTKNGTVKPTIMQIYTQKKDNPSTDEYHEHNLEKFKNTIQLSYYDNYGSVSGYYIKHREDDLYINTLSKVEKLRDELSLKAASYTIGGLGDCTTHKPENSYEISVKQLNVLLSQGWSIKGEFKEIENYGISAKELNPNAVIKS